MNFFLEKKDIMVVDIPAGAATEDTGDGGYGGYGGDYGGYGNVGYGGYGGLGYGGLDGGYGGYGGNLGSASSNALGGKKQFLNMLMSDQYYSPLLRPNVLSADYFHSR